MYETMSGEHVTLKVVNKISGILKFLYLKNSFFNTWASKNAMHCPHATTFDYACSEEDFKTIGCLLIKEYNKA